MLHVFGWNWFYNPQKKYLLSRFRDNLDVTLIISWSLIPDIAETTYLLVANMSSQLLSLVGELICWTNPPEPNVSRKKL